MWLRTMLHNEIPCNSIPNHAIPCHLKVDMEEYTHWSPSWSYEHHQKSGLKHHYYQEGFLSGWLFHKRTPHGQRVEICWECFLRQGSDQLRWCPNEGHTYCDLVIIFWRKDNMFNWEIQKRSLLPALGPLHHLFKAVLHTNLSTTLLSEEVEYFIKINWKIVSRWIWCLLCLTMMSISWNMSVIMINLATEGKQSVRYWVFFTYKLHLEFFASY